MKHTFRLIADYLEDLLIAAGLFVINIATYRLGVIPGLYCSGFTLLATGIFFAQYPLRRR